MQNAIYVFRLGKETPVAQGEHAPHTQMGIKPSTMVLTTKPLCPLMLYINRNIYSVLFSDILVVELCALIYPLSV